MGPRKCVGWKSAELQWLCQSPLPHTHTPLYFPQAAGDARRLMGSRRYYDLMLSDACHHHQLKFTDEMDVTTVKEYMQVCMCVRVRVCIHVCVCVRACEVV